MQNILGTREAFILHRMYTWTGWRRREDENEARISWFEKLGRKEEPRKRCNEILANAFVFAMWLHRDVRMEVIGIPRMSRCNNSILYVNVPAFVCNSEIQVIRSAMLCRILFAVTM